MVYCASGRVDPKTAGQRAENLLPVVTADMFEVGSQDTEHDGEVRSKGLKLLSYVPFSASVVVGTRNVPHGLGHWNTRSPCWWHCLG